MSSSTVVVGGGVAGLLAARRRALAGDRVTVLVPEAEPGGAVAFAVSEQGQPIASGRFTPVVDKKCL